MMFAELCFCGFSEVVGIYMLALCHQRSFALQAAWFLIFIFAEAATLFSFLLSRRTYF